MMWSQALRLLVVFLLLESAFGMVCYRCETKAVKETSLDKEPESVNAKGPDDKIEPVPPTPAPGPPSPPDPTPKPGRSARRIRDADDPPPKEPVINPRREKVADCVLGGKDDKDHWEVYECPVNIVACYNLKGTLAERSENNVTLYQVTKRDCFEEGASGSDVKHNKDQMTKGELKTEAGTYKGTAKIYVCDDLNAGEMLCNQGITTMVNFNYFAVSGIAMGFLIYFAY